MALRNQPYIPLYVQDFMTDEKLRECSPASIGVYVFIMCLMHKSKDYGKILLRQKDRQTPNPIINFGEKLAKHLPFSSKEITLSLKELLEEDVMFIDGDELIQKRMVKDNRTSEARSKAGSKGAKATNKKLKFAAAKSTGTSENESENESESGISIVLEKFEKPFIDKPTKEEFLEYAKGKLGELFNTYKLSIEFKYDSWVENNWHTGGDKPREIKNWKTTLLNTLPHLKEVAKANKKEGGAMEALMSKHNLKN